MIFLQAATSKTGPSLQCFKAAASGAVRLLTCPSIIREVYEVLNRPELQAKFKNLTFDVIVAFLHQVVTIAENQPDPPRQFVLSRDPDDEPYVNLAIASGANYIVTRDRDLLSLSDVKSPEGHNFRTEHPDIFIVDPVEFLKQIAKPV